MIVRLELHGAEADVRHALPTLLKAARNQRCELRVSGRPRLERKDTPAIRRALFAPFGSGGRQLG